MSIVNLHKSFTPKIVETSHCAEKPARAHVPGPPIIPHLLDFVNRQNAQKNPQVALPGVSALLSTRGAHPRVLLSRTALDSGMGSIGSTPQEPLGTRAGKSDLVLRSIVGEHELSFGVVDGELFHT